MNASKLLNAADIIAAKDRKYLDVDVPQWGGTVRLWELSAADAIEFEEYSKNHKDSMLRIVVLCTGDEAGNRLFTDEQIDALKPKGLSALLLLQERALKLNDLSVKALDAMAKRLRLAGYTVTEEQETEEPEAAAKNGSGATVSGASPTDSPVS